ncbi:hypothetical protein Pflav_046670 [Phytohabitans flavus]|uniref:Uncharacterized protein n=1 Tax=Phytohabitans flavus TaxID=1076124 RepID=A0A6F8XWT6_9ACTN|nr:hypothetical protein Pflav_046670 [Phytohabitans flavus]
MTESDEDGVFDGRAESAGWDGGTCQLCDYGGVVREAVVAGERDVKDALVQSGTGSQAPVPADLLGRGTKICWQRCH